MCEHFQTVNSKAIIHYYNLFALPISIANYYEFLDKAAWKSRLTCLLCVVAELEEGAVLESRPQAAT